MGTVCLLLLLVHRDTSSPQRHVDDDDTVSRRVSEPEVLPSESAFIGR